MQAIRDAALLLILLLVVTSVRISPLPEVTPEVNAAGPAISAGLPEVPVLAPEIPCEAASPPGTSVHQTLTRMQLHADALRHEALSRVRAVGAARIDDCDA